MVTIQSVSIWVFVFGITRTLVTSKELLNTVNEESNMNHTFIVTNAPMNSATDGPITTSGPPITSEPTTLISTEYEEEILSTLNPIQQLDEEKYGNEIVKPTIDIFWQNRDITSLPRTPGGCPDLGNIKNQAKSLIKCQCEGNEVLVDGRCKLYEGNLEVDAQVDFIKTKPVNVSDYDVTTRDVSCDATQSRYMEFNKGHFHLRDRGDIVLLRSAGNLEGQRISKYCINYQLDDSGELTWTLRACIPVPSIPRCCPRGQAMKEGSCQPANSPDFLQPPVGASHFGASTEWPNITNYIRPVSCIKYPLMTELLSYKQSHLVSLPDGVFMAWIPDERREYKNCTEYCVDGIEKTDGTIDYYASFCHADPYEFHKQVCGDGPCLRKCCKKGEVIDLNQYRCVSHLNATFDPPTSKNVSHYNIVEGWPLCTPITQPGGKIRLDKNGNLIHEGMTLVPTDYCVDMFVNNDLQEQSALACLSKITLWQKVRPIIFPICNVISLVFLAILLICHLLAPNLLKNGGVHQLGHAVALSIAYMSSFTVFVFRIYLGDDGCFVIAIVMQFGFLTTFFWLNVMCFEIWRKIRHLKHFRSCRSYPSWLYMLYAWGIPVIMCAITVAMQFLAPEDVAGVIKPHIGVSRCWFNDDLELLVYFYGPIAFLFICNSILLGLTYINYKQMLNSYKETHKCLKDLGTGITSVNPNSKSSMPSRQLTDHVNDYKQRLQLFVLMATCWVTEVLSWKIQPLELWAPTDTLNSLQGFFIFIIFLLNRNKRKQLEEKFPSLFKLLRKIKMPQNLRNRMWGSFSSISPVNSIISKVSKKLSNSADITTITSSFESSSSSSVNVTSTDAELKRSVSMDESEQDIVVLSHLPVKLSKSDQ